MSKNNHGRRVVMWVALGLLAVLLVGVIIWAFAGRLETTVSAALEVGSDGSIVLFIPDDEIDCIEAGQTVRMPEQGALLLSVPGEENGTIGTEQAMRILEQEYTLSAVASQPVAAQSVLEDYALHIAGFTEEQLVWPATVTGDTAMAEGVYSVEIVTKAGAPISFLFH